jgi:hypothetical protein
LLPPLLEAFRELLVESGGHLVGFAVFVQGDRLADVVDHDLARIAPFQVLLELFADRQVHIAVDVLVQSRHQFFAVHVRALPRLD